MNEQEFEDTLQYLQLQMREYGLADLNERIVADIRAEPASPDHISVEPASADYIPVEPASASAQVLHYLDALNSELRLRSARTAQRILESFVEIVETESGGPIDGLTVLVTEDDQRLFGTEVIDLLVAPDLSEVIANLEELQSELRQSRD